MKNTLLDEAIRYAEKGWFVFPTREVASEPFEDNNGKIRVMKEKTPYIKGGFQSATTDKDQITKWWTIYPNAGIGVSCGHSNLVVVDIDVKGDRQGFNNFMKLNVSDEGALHSLTPSGGMHIIYTGKTNSYANVRDGIDLRSQGSYIVAPPSWIIKDEKKLPYILLDDWTRVPINVPCDLIKKLNLLRKGEDHKRGISKTSKVLTEDRATIIKRAKIALEMLPQEFCDERNKWISVGLTLKNIGEDAFCLWDSWSSRSKKYDPENCKYVWEKMNPREISVASLFYWANKGGL